MALVHNGFSTYRLFATFQTVAHLNAAFSECCWLISINDLWSRWSLQSASRPLPGSVFDSRYEGLTAHAARIDAAICRQMRLR